VPLLPSISLSEKTELRRERKIEEKNNRERREIEMEAEEEKKK
jgi:hypothetical protein